MNLLRLIVVLLSIGMLVWTDVWFYTVAVENTDKGMWFFVNAVLAAVAAGVALDEKEPS